MKKTKTKTKAKTRVSRIEKHTPGFTQEQACVEVVADLQEMLDSERDIDDNAIVRLMRNRGVAQDFIREVLDSRKIEKEKEKAAALSGLRAAYRKLPKHLKEILDNMDSDDICEAICGTED